MRPYSLCGDVRGFAQCDCCRRNPERPENILAADDGSQPWHKPNANEHGCRDQLHAELLEETP